jgi:hypothetical protein
MSIKRIQVTFDPDDPVQERLGRALEMLPRGTKNMFFLQLLSAQFGDAPTEVLQRRMVDFVYRRDVAPQNSADDADADADDDRLEDGHKRHQDKSKPLEEPKGDKPLGQAPKSAPLGKPPESEPFGKPQVRKPFVRPQAAKPETFTKVPRRDTLQIQ